MDSFVKNDVFKYKIWNQLETKDLFNLSEGLENDSIKNMIVKKSLLEISKRLKKVFGDKYEEFILLLNSNKAIISGSFLMQCILNEEWKGSDIDIFIPMKGNKITQTSSDNPMTEIDDFLFSNMEFESYHAAERYGNDIDNKIRWFRTFVQKEQKDVEIFKYSDYRNNKNGNPDEYKVQTILVDIESDEMNDFIISNFDFDICKNIFSKGELSIYNLKDLATKVTQFKVGNRLGSSIERARRYTKRGFTFTDKELPMSRIEDLFKIDSENIFSQHIVIFSENYLKLRNETYEKDNYIIEKCEENCPLMFFRPDVSHRHIRSNGPGRENIILYKE